jgi:hypothetical protein
MPRRSLVDPEFVHPARVNHLELDPECFECQFEPGLICSHCSYNVERCESGCELCGPVLEARRVALEARSRGASRHAQVQCSLPGLGPGPVLEPFTRAQG